MRLKASCPILMMAACSLGVGSAQAAEVRVAVAANFAAPMQQIARQFEQDTPHRLQVSVGSTGKFYAQIRNGASLHILLAADEATPQRLEAEGLTLPGTRFTYATGRIVVWSARAGQAGDLRDALLAPNVQRIAVADPKLAPYGVAAFQAMAGLGLTSAMQPKLVYGESIGQAFQFVATGNATLGFVALSQVTSNGKLASGSVWPVPEHLYTPLRQDAVAMRGARDNAGVTALLAYMKSAPAQAVIRAFGYTP